jgi:outer membrane lipoprotein-sorting protein
MRRIQYLAAVGLAVAVTLSLAASGASLKECSDYRGKGKIRVLLQPDTPMKPGDRPNELGAQFEQVFLRPDRMLLSVDWFGLRQQMLAQGSTEQIYQPAMGMVIEKKYLNLQKADENPILALQTSMVQAGRLLREAKSAKTLGQEKLLGYECEIVEADSKEILEKMGDLVSPTKGNGVNSGKVKAWVVSGYGVPLKLEVYTAAGNLAASLSMEELQLNTGVKPEELKLAVPSGTKKVSIDVDMAARDWERKMNQDLQKAVAALRGNMPGS